MEWTISATRAASLCRDSATLGFSGRMPADYNPEEGKAIASAKASV